MSEEEIKIPEEISKPENIEQSGLVSKTEGIPMKVNDLRDERYKSFDLEKFLSVIARLREEDFYKLSREFKDSEFGKYMSCFGSNESDNWDEAVKEATALEITLSTPENRGHEFLEGRTDVEVKILMNGNQGRVFNFNFNNDGTYRQGGFQDVFLHKQLSGETEDVFTLVPPDSFIEDSKKR